MLQFHINQHREGRHSFLWKDSFRIVSSESPETMRKLCLSTKFPHQEITLFDLEIRMWRVLFRIGYLK